MLYRKTKPKVTHQMSLRSTELRVNFPCSGGSRLLFWIGRNKCAATFISGRNDEIVWKSEEKTFCSLFVRLAACFCWFLLHLFLDPKFGEAMFLRNVGLSPNYTVLQPTIPHSSLNVSYTYHDSGPRLSCRLHLGFVFTSNCQWGKLEISCYALLLLWLSFYYFTQLFGSAINQTVSRRRPTAAVRVDPKSVRVGFVVDKMALGRVLSE
jgi:hypothetical protein